MLGGWVLMVRSQSSLIEVLILCVGVSVCLSFLLYNNFFSVEELRSDRIESEEVLLSYLNYKPIFYNESFSFLIKVLDSSFFSEGSLLFNESVRVIECLNYNNSFILFVNSSYSFIIYNKQESVCLSDAQLASYEFDGVKIVYGSWKGEARLKC